MGFPIEADEYWTMVIPIHSLPTARFCLPTVVLKDAPCGALAAAIILRSSLTQTAGVAGRCFGSESIWCVNLLQLWLTTAAFFAPLILDNTNIFDNISGSWLNPGKKRWVIRTFQETARQCSGGYLWQCSIGYPRTSQNGYFWSWEAHQGFPPCFLETRDISAGNFLVNWNYMHLDIELIRLEEPKTWETLISSNLRLYFRALPSNFGWTVRCNFINKWPPCWGHLHCYLYTW